MQLDNTAEKQHGVIAGVSCLSPVFAILSGGISINAFDLSSLQFQRG